MPNYGSLCVLTRTHGLICMRYSQRPHYEISQLSEFFVDELAGLHEDINSYNSHGQTVQAALESERLDSLDFCLKGLLMLTSTLCECSGSVVAELQHDDTFLGVLAFIFICEETSTFGCPPFLVEIAKLKLHAIAFLNHPTILEALLRSGLVKVDSVFTAILASAVASSSADGNLLVPRCFLDNVGLNSWYSRWYRLNGPSYTQCVSLVVTAMALPDLQQQFAKALSAPPHDVDAIVTRTTARGVENPAHSARLSTGASVSSADRLRFSGRLSATGRQRARLCSGDCASDPCALDLHRKRACTATTVPLVHRCCHSAGSDGTVLSARE
jgi:hypothetical protein